MPFLRTDPDETRRAAEAALAQTETKITELLRQREAKLIDADYAGGIDAIDRQLDVHRRAAVIHRDRIAALILKQHSDTRDRLEKEKADKIADTEKRLARRDAAAEKLELALSKVREAYTELMVVDEAVLSSGLSYLSAASLPALCRRDRRPADPVPRLVIGSVRAIADGAGEGLAVEIRQKGLDLLDLMRAEPTPEPHDESNDNAEIAA